MNEFKNHRSHQTNKKKKIRKRRISRKEEEEEGEEEEHEKCFIIVTSLQCTNKHSQICLKKILSTCSTVMPNHIK